MIILRKEKNFIQIFSLTLPYDLQTIKIDKKQADEL